MAPVADEDIGPRQNGVEVDVVLDDHVLLRKASSELFCVLMPGPNDEQGTGRNEPLQGGADQLAGILVVDRPLGDQHHATVAGDARELRRVGSRAGSVGPQ